jgi:predicted DNA-binding WGR domain protein
MRRFELSDGSSNKFWEVEYVDSSDSFTVRWGRIGTNGQTQTKTSANSSKASAEYTKLVKEKVDKGYNEVDGATGSLAPVAIKVATAISQTAATKPTTATKPTVATKPAPPTTTPPAPALASDEDAVRWSPALAKLTLPSRHRTGWALSEPIPSDEQILAKLGTAQNEWQKPIADSVNAFATGDATDQSAINSVLAHTNGGAAALVGLRAGWEVALSCVADLLRNPPQNTNLAWSPWAYELRCRFAVTDDVTYNIANTVAQRFAEDPLVGHVFAPIFPDEPWAAAIVDSLVATRPDLIGDIPSLATRTTTPAHSGWDIWGRPTSDGVSLYQRFGDAALELILSFPVSTGDDKKIRSRLLAAIGSDVAFNLLIADIDDRVVQPFLIEAANAQPRRAVRLLSAVKGKHTDIAKARVAALLQKHPNIASELTDLTADQRRMIDSIVAAKVAPAPEDMVPPALLHPAWAGNVKAERPIVLDATVSVPEPVLEWTDKEKLIAGSQHHSDYMAWRDKPIQPGEASPVGIVRILKADGYAMLSMRPVQEGYYNDACLQRVLERFKADAIPYVCKAICLWPRDHLKSFPYLGSADIAVPAGIGVWSKSLREPSRTWLLRFPHHAAAGLIPLALGKLGKNRDAAEKTLRFLATNGHAETITLVAATGGQEVAAAVNAVLNLDPLSLYPTKMPGTPAWLAAGALQSPILKDGSGSLPVNAVTNVVAMLAFSDIDDPYAGIDILRETCTPESIADFGWSLFNQWLSAGAPSPSSWALTMLGLLGNDDVARSLSSYIFTWPGEGGHSKAVSGLDVLARIGTDVSLMYLNRIAERAQFAGLKKTARERIDQIAEDRGLTPEELADRLVPDLGLDENGTMWFDFGPRKFQVGFDESLLPFVKDEMGAKLRALPKPNSKDDAALASGASEQWKALKKDAAAAAKVQMRRIELGMTLRRHWSIEQFEQFFVHHPLMGHVARRLVWGVYDVDGKLDTTFRIAEDRTYADHTDEACDLPGVAAIGIPHVLELMPSLQASWGELLADYEMVQPFNQLGRETFSITEPERVSTKLQRIAGTQVHFGKIISLETKGWVKGSVEDAGTIWEMLKPLPNNLWATLHLPEGLWLSMMSETPIQILEHVQIRRGQHSYGETSLLQFGSLDPIVFSELVRDLESLKS